MFCVDNGHVLDQWQANWQRLLRSRFRVRIYCSVYHRVLMCGRTKIGKINFLTNILRWRKSSAISRRSHSSAPATQLATLQFCNLPLLDSATIRPQPEINRSHKAPLSCPILTACYDYATISHNATSPHHRLHHPVSCATLVLHFSAPPSATHSASQLGNIVLHFSAPPSAPHLANQLGNFSS